MSRKKHKKHNHNRNSSNNIKEISQLQTIEQPIEEEKRKQQHKEKNQAIIERIIELWVHNIDEHVNIQALSNEINRLMTCQYTLDYILYTVKYCIQNHLNLHYPGGVKYFLKDPSIHNEYIRKALPKYKPEDFIVQDSANAPEFNPPAPKKQGFGSILN